MSEPQIVQSPITSHHSIDEHSSCTLVSNSFSSCWSAPAMAYNESVDDFRDIEYPMMKGKTYLDHAGTTVYSKSLIEEFSRKMVTNLYGNPHSGSDPAQLSGYEVDSIREKALAFVKADPEHFDLVFTANATAAIKMVGECFRDLASASPNSSTFWYGYHKDAHTSAVGLREITKGNHHCFTSDEEVENWLNNFQATFIAPSSSTIPGLFCFPGQSNMTGRRLPLSWTKKLRQSNVPSHQNTYSLLDAAALATTSQLDFSDPDSAPDFTAISFYKIFGFPDLGALIVRKESGHILGWRKYYGGGTVNSLTVLHETSVQRKDATLHDALEDGTLPFHNIIALGCAIDVHKKLYGSMKTISQHTSYLSRRLYLGMANIHHSNGNPLCIIYNDIPDRCEYGDPVTQGATIAFNLMKANGGYLGHSTVEKIANEKGIFLRSGGLCNAGGIATYLNMEPWQFKRAWSAGHRCGEEGIDLINRKPTGVVRASLGAMSTIADVDTFLIFLAEVFVEQPREAMELAQLDDFQPLPATYEVVQGVDSGYDRGSESITLSALKTLDSRSSRSSIPQKVIGIQSFVNVHSSYPKRSVYEQRPPPNSSSTVQHKTVYHAIPDPAKTAVPVGSMRYISDSAPRGDCPMIYHDRPQTTSREEKRGSLTKLWKRRKSFLQ